MQIIVTEVNTFYMLCDYIFRGSLIHCIFDVINYGTLDDSWFNFFLCLLSLSLGHLLKRKVKKAIIINILQMLCLAVCVTMCFCKVQRCISFSVINHDFNIQGGP